MREKILEDINLQYIPYCTVFLPNVMQTPISPLCNANFKYKISL